MEASELWRRAKWWSNGVLPKCEGTEAKLDDRCGDHSKNDDGRRGYGGVITTERCTNDIFVASIEFERMGRKGGHGDLACDVSATPWSGTEVTWCRNRDPTIHIWVATRHLLA